MNDKTNYRGFWRAVVYSVVLSLFAFWLPLVLTVLVIS